ncbi:hypothetical protein FACS1894199_14310 [Bacteroidia bacterium]|nr:hypothetical protein FACS1894199_14310 [Bacteroidia bacterium]
MKTANKEKDFDCVKMKNDIQAKIYAETKDMTTEELLAYFNRNLEGNKFWQQISAQPKKYNFVN